MTNGLSTNQSFTAQSKDNRVIRLLSAMVLVLAILTASVPGALTIMRRADAQVALGNAKSLRIALQVASTEAYAAGRLFSDQSAKSGVSEEVWREVVLNSKIPGDFWVLQMDESGYEVLRFLYQEGDFTVSYCKEPLTYEVHYQKQYIETRFDAAY